METTSSTSPPSFSRALLLWMATLGLGAILLASSVFLRNAELDNELTESLVIALLCSAYAAVLAAPVLLILPVALRWAAGAATLLQRWTRALLVVGGLFGVAVFCGYLFLTSGNKDSSEAELLWFAVPYLPAALLATAYIYRAWLFRS